MWSFEQCLINDLISQDILAYLKQHENKDLLRFLTCGNVDDGKSTLIGRLLYDSKLIYEDQLQAVTRDSKKVGTTGDAPDLALLVDGLQAEREQGITIDVAYRYFSTEKRKFIIADTPGRECERAPGHVEPSLRRADGSGGDCWHSAQGDFAEWLDGPGLWFTRQRQGRGAL